MATVAACVVAVCVPPPAAPAGHPPEGEIRGFVIDRTAPAHLLQGQAVTLTIAERGSTAERSTRTDAGGGFVFAGLPIGGIRVFLVQTEYAGVRYESERIELSPESPARVVSLFVYERTRDRSAVHEALAFGVVEIAPGGVRVSVLRRFENPTDRTVVIPATDPLRFPLPPGAEAVAFLAGWETPRVLDGSITDAFPIRPGSPFVSYAYELEARGPDLVVPWSFPAGTAGVEILVADAGVRVAGTGLSRAGTVTEKGHRYQRWSGGPIRPGGGVAVELDGLPTARSVWPGVVAAVLAIVLGGGLAAALRRHSRVAQARRT
jgi:hypothetical protein